MYNPENRSGYFFNKLKNARKKGTATITLPHNLSDDEVQEIYTYFKTCVVSNELGQIKQKLIETAEHRKQLTEHVENKFDEIYDFFFAAPELVIRLFELTFISR